MKSPTENLPLFMAATAVLGNRNRLDSLCVNAVFKTPVNESKIHMTVTSGGCLDPAALAFGCAELMTLQGACGDVRELADGGEI